MHLSSSPSTSSRGSLDTMDGLHHLLLVLGGFNVDAASPLFNRVDQYRKGDAVVFAGELYKVSAYKDKKGEPAASLEVALSPIAWCPRNDLDKKRPAEEDIASDEASKRARVDEE
ncbi:hypothetical protein BCR44DRAFT_57871 [Catenaria anguillulae PL171]|uniref:Uncharacterized protein n=1 Tax=Catenaria anguillulae PL171 TaxID=765915 RepID=A0A1Y2H3T3_9FUNG|nr:hypothetical protein BCR44DRAFT_57871 [Catenaria anguillulae PL171]